jgi:hypothetical protein
MALRALNSARIRFTHQQDRFAGDEVGGFDLANIVGASQATEGPTHG